MLLAASSGLSCLAASVSTGSGTEAIQAEADRQSGLNTILVVNAAGTAEITYSGSSPNQKWYRYSNLGGGYAEEIDGVVYEGSTSTLPAAELDMGYIVEDGDSRYYFWLVGYRNYPFSVASVSVSDESDCDRTVLLTEGTGAEIHYYGINGRRFTLDREIKVEYYNLEWNDEKSEWQQTETVKTIPALTSQIPVVPPVYCATTFTVSGDRFSEQWGTSSSATSGNYQPKAVDCRTSATQEEKAETEEGSNEINGGGDGLGGSAPADIHFEAYITDAVIHQEWQISSDPTFDDITYRLSGQELDFTFREEGHFYVRFFGSNADGSCETYGETYTVDIGASELKCPNAFSPGASEGVNDEWKVSYRSLVEFECWIFDRYGTQMYHFKDPAGGWDGRYKGKLVAPGVYYYVIKAKGADGKNYKRSGDINILRFKGRKGNQGSTE